MRRGEAVDNFNKAVNKFKFGKFSGKQRTLDKIGILMIERRYRKNDIKIGDKVYSWDQVPEEYKNKIGWLLQDDNSIDGIGGDDTEAYQRIKEAWDDLVKDDDGTLNIEESIKALSPEEKAILDEARKSFDNLEELNRSNTVAQGQVYKKVNDYVSLFTIQSQPGVQAESESANFEQRTNEAFDKPYQPVQKIATSVFQATGKLLFTETDISKILNRHAREVTHNAYVNDAYNNTMAALTKQIQQNQLKPLKGEIKTS